ncbi:MAG: ammonium transporter [Methylococcaceae bacterium]|nr:MAG: ammonium transporter [Methylococcaceae bacterium]
MNTTRKPSISLGCALWLLPLAASADELNSADTAWILTSAALVLFMTVPGLALFYGGLVRTKNVLSVLVNCFAITSLASILWVVVGYSLALTEGNSWLGGWSRLLLSGMDADSLHGNLPESVYVMYHLTFAIFAPALIVGGLVERMKFSALLAFVALWLLLVYVPVCHWLWGGGWLQQMGVMDFAGGIVVHTSGGIAALMAALMLGPRRGFPRTPMPPHNLTMTATGGGILWVGWHGFSAGSALMANGAAGMAMLTTHIAAAAAALVWMGIEWLRFGKPSVLGVITGMVAGLGMVSPAAGFIGPGGALLIGITAGAVCLFSILWIKRRLGVDDALDVFPVHGIGGMVGAVLTGVFAAESLGGRGLAGDAGMLAQVALQAFGVGVTLAWSGGVSFMLLKGLDLALGLRVNPDEETEGLDIALHDSKGYNP